jgi:hypothetical protein
VIRVYVGAVLLVLAGLGIWVYGHHQYDAGVASVQAQDNALRAKWAIEVMRDQEAKGAALDAAAQQYHEDLAHVQEQTDRTLASERAGTIRLRQRWLSCTAEAAAAARGGPSADGTADRGAGIALDLFRAVDPLVQRQDAKIRGLQAALRADRAHTPASP